MNSRCGKGTVPFSLRENRDSPQVILLQVLSCFDGALENVVPRTKRSLSIFSAILSNCCGKRGFSIMMESFGISMTLKKR